MNNASGMFAPQRRAKWCLLYLLGGSLAACGGSGRDAAPTAAVSPTATAALVGHGGVSAPTTYSVVNIDPASSSIDPFINASNQVAFTGQRGDHFRAGFFNGEQVLAIGTFGGLDSYVGSINDAGQVAGGSTDAGGIMSAYRWTEAGGKVRLATVGDTAETRAVGINRSGQVAGFSSRLAPDADYARASLWSPTGAGLDLGTLGGGWSYADAINSAGTVAGRSGKADGTTRAFLWSAAGGMVELSGLNGRMAEARLINDAGQAAGLWSPADEYPYRGFVWDPAFGMVDIGTLGGATSFPHAFNAAGQVAGSADLTGDSPIHAVSWTRAGGLVDLGTFGGGYSEAFGINKSGQVVGNAQLDQTHRGLFRAYVWTAAQGMIDLNTRLPHIPDGLVLTSALAISDSGAIVADSNAGLVLLKPGAVGTDAPLIGPISPDGPVLVATRIPFSASFLDQNSGDSHSATWSWNDGCGHPDDVLKARAGTTVRAAHTFCKSGQFTVTLTVTDSSGRSTAVSRDVMVYNYFPVSGAVAGSGWLMSPRGANKQDRVQSGRASFAFAATAQPDRKMTLRFRVGKLAFASTAYESLSVAAGRADYQGRGTLNGAANYRFSMAVAGGDATPGRLRMKIWHADPRSGADVVDYDNQAGGAALSADDGSTVAGGGIVIRR